MPVARPLGVHAVGFVKFPAAVDEYQPAGEQVFREPVVHSGHCGGGQGDTCAADLRPVVAGIGPPVTLVINGFGGFEGFLDDGAFAHRALLRCESVVEPIVTGRHGAGHFRGVEEVRGIPVFQGAGGLEFGDGSLPEFFPAANAPRPAAVHNVVKGEAGFEQQAFTVGDFIAAGPLFQDPLGLGHRGGLQLCGQRIFRELFAQRGFRGFRQPQPWMRFLRQTASCQRERRQPDST